MDFRDFRASAYLKNSGTNKENTGNNSSTKTVKPASFRRIDLSNQKSNSEYYEPKKDTQSYTNTKLNSSTLNSGYDQRKFGVESNYIQKPEQNIDFTKGIQKSASQRLESATEYLKSGGLLKVPIKSSPDGKDTVFRRVAKFLILIGEDEAAKILPLLPENQIEKIIPEIASIRTVSKDEASVILEEFNSYVKQVKEQGGVETAKEMLIKAYGRKRAEEMLKKAIPAQTVEPFSYLNNLDSERIYLLLKDENVGMQALVLSYLEPKTSAKVISLMEGEDKTAIILRLAKMEPVSPEVLRRVDQGMREKTLNLTVEETENIDGRNALAQILKKMDIKSENEILENLTEEDPDLGRDLKNRLFTTEDVVNADDRFIQERLREMTEDDIVYLIAGKDNEFKEKILSNVSANRRKEIYERNEILTVKRKSVCDDVTKTFLAKLRTAFEDGDLIIHNRNDDLFV